jgi:hypothetical protein
MNYGVLRGDSFYDLVLIYLREENKIFTSKDLYKHLILNDKDP